MTTELKGRYAYYFTGDKANGTIEHQVRLSLNQVKVNFGADIAREVIAKKQFSLGNTHWFELELLPGEKNADETAREKLKKELCFALYEDLRQSYSFLTLASVIADVDKLIKGGEPTGVIQMFAHRYLIETGLIKAETPAQ